MLIIIMIIRDNYLSQTKVIAAFLLEHGGHGEEPWVLPAGGAARAEEGDGHPAEEDPHGHGEFSLLNLTLFLLSVQGDTCVSSVHIK